MFVLFIATNIYLEKGEKPQWLIDAGLFKIILAGVAFIAVSLVLSIVVSFILVAVWGTIAAACVISWKYRMQFNAIKKEKKHV